jgi:photosystem II stability/assembly factor-like uncharacterized protein
MKNVLLVLPILILAFIILPAAKSKLAESSDFKDLKPHDQYQLGRNYPNIGEGAAAYERAVLKATKKYRNQNTPWTQEGATNIGGRINTIAVDPNNANIIYVGTPNAGIFKTTDGGNTWDHKFGQQHSLAIGVLAIDPNNSNTIYAGTGDEALSSFTYMGNGLWKSSDAGNTWNYIGLKDTRVISQLIIHPTNSNIIYVGTMGNIYSMDNNRGLYKTTDGGLNWTQVLYLGSDAGIGDMAINEAQPDTLFVTGRNRFRSNQVSNTTGPAARIYRTYNGGQSWDTLTNGLPSGDQCKITIALSQNNSQLIYASYCDTSMNYSGFYRSTNGGNSWSFMSQDNDMSMGGFGWYFGEIFLDPNDDNRVYWCAIDLFRTTNGGSTWSRRAPPWYTYDVHADKHDIQFVNSNTFFLATDGGIYRTNSGGGNNSSAWNNITNMPITQYYKVGYNPWDSLNYYAGAQDNGTQVGSAASGINNWQRYFGGDGFKPSFDQADEDTWYTQTQRGNINSTIDGGNNYDNITQSLTATDRSNWNTPYFLSPHNTKTMYVGTYKVYKNTYAPIDNWTAISGDLTDGIDNSNHVLSSIDQSEINNQLLYAGTSDGNVWVTQNDGTSWTQINAGLPDRYVSCIKASPNNVANAFLSYWGYRDNDTNAYIYFTNNYGNSWTSIASTTLPNFAINDIWIRPDGTDSSIIIANDGGVYSTTNRGTTWMRVGNNMSIYPVYDIEYNPATKKIFAGTFAMSLQSIGIDSAFETPPPVINVGLQQQKIADVKIYPNPCKNQLQIELGQASNLSITLLDIHGKILLEQTDTHAVKKHSVNLHNIASGIYLIKIISNEGEVIKKIFKE